MTLYGRTELITCAWSLSVPYDLGANLCLYVSVSVCVSHFPLKWKFEYIWVEHSATLFRVEKNVTWQNALYTIDDHSMKAHNRFGAILLNACMYFFPSPSSSSSPFAIFALSLSLAALFSHLILKCLVFKRPFFKSIPLNCVKTTMIKWLCVQHKQNGKIPTAKKYVGTLLIGWALLRFTADFYQFQESSNKSDRKIEMHSSKIMHKTVLLHTHVHI